MDIVTALGGEFWFNFYCALHLMCLMVIAGVSFASLVKMIFEKIDSDRWGKEPPHIHRGQNEAQEKI